MTTMDTGYQGWPVRARLLLRAAGAAFVAGLILFVVGVLVGSRDELGFALGLVLVGLPTVFLTTLLAGLAVVSSRPVGGVATARAMAFVLVGALGLSAGLLGVIGILASVSGAAVAMAGLAAVGGAGALYGAYRMAA